MNKPKVISILLIMMLLLLMVGPSINAFARPLNATSPVLTVLLGYSVLGGGSITNVPTTTTNGNIGVSPGTVTGGGYAGGGTLHSNDSSAIAAQAEALVTFGLLAQGCDHSFADGTDLSITNVGSGVGNLPPGVYCSAGSFLLTKTVNLAGSGVWIFRTVSTLITSPGSSVTGGDPCNVWWRIGSSTTLDTTTSFIGTIISQNGVNAMNTGATLNGRFLTLSAGTVTLNQNTITSPACTAPQPVATSEFPGKGPKATELALKKANTVGGLPNTGGAPIRNQDFPWYLVIITGVSVFGLVSGVRIYRRTHLPKQ